MTYNTVYVTVRKELKRYPYKIQLMNGLKLDDRPAEEQFARIMIPHLDQSDPYLNKICVSGKPTGPSTRQGWSTDITHRSKVEKTQRWYLSALDFLS